MDHPYTSDAEPPPQERELQHKQRHLHVLGDAWNELRGLDDPSDVMDAFLLLVLGGLGAAKGFAILADPASLQARLYHRGLEQHEQERLTQHFADLRHGRLADMLCLDAPPPAGVQLAARNVPGDPTVFPEGTSILARYSLEPGCTGVVGLGRKLTDAPYSDADADLLLGLANHMAAALNRVLAARSLTSLNQDLARRNEMLEQTLGRAIAARAELDRQLWRLNTLYDATLELGPMQEPHAVMDAFLLLLTGVFSLREAYVLSAPSSAAADSEIAFACRTSTGDQPTAPGAEQVKNFLFLCLQAADFGLLTPMRGQVLEPGVFADLPESAQAPLPTSLGVFFRLDANHLGFIGLGERITGEPYSENDRELLLTHAGNFFVFFNNAKAFKTIGGLNEDLARRNQELQTTIEELTASRRRIEVLERAGDQLKSLVQHETARLGKVTWLDVVLVLAASVCIGLLFNMANPNSVDVIPPSWLRPASKAVSLDQAKAAYYHRNVAGHEAVFVDARPSQLFEEEHIEGAVNLPPSLFDFVYAMNLADMDRDQMIIVYGRTISSRYDEDVAHRLGQQGHTRVMVLPDGLEAWKAMELPVASE